MVAREERARDDVRVSDESRSWRRRRRACCRCRSRNRSRSRSRSRISRQYAYRQLPHTKHIDKRTHTQTLHTHTYTHNGEHTQSVRMEKAFLHFFNIFFCSLFHSFPSFTCAHCGCTDTIYTLYYICYVYFIYLLYISIIYLPQRLLRNLNLATFAANFR